MADFSEDEDLEIILTQVTEQDLLDAAVCGSDDELTIQKLLEMPDLQNKKMGEVVEILAAQKKVQRRS